MIARDVRVLQIGKWTMLPSGDVSRFARVMIGGNTEVTIPLTESEYEAAVKRFNDDKREAWGLTLGPLTLRGKHAFCKH